MVHRYFMDDTNSLIEQRRAKLKALEARGIFPFQNKFTPTESCQQARDNYIEGREVAVAGRITAHREMGKSMFIDVRDQSGRIQVYAQKNVLGDEQWNIFTHLDLGDFVGVRGTLFTTKTGEISIKLGGSTGSTVGQASSLSSKTEANEENKESSLPSLSSVKKSGTGKMPVPPFVILAKALRPPPAKWHGLEDTEIRYRQRYLDLMANPDVKEIFLKRSAIIHEIRQFFHSRGYVEVETPAMQAIPGGAAAQPFVTHHNALGCDFYLRIALELYHKRLLVGGIDKLFEIGKNFRNEGLSRRHNPEFTMLEAYCAFSDYATMMETVESLICHVAKKVVGTLEIAHENRQLIGQLIDSCVQKLNRDLGEIITEMAKAGVATTPQGRDANWLLEQQKNFTDAFKQLHSQIGATSTLEIAEAASRQIAFASNFFTGIYAGSKSGDNFAKFLAEHEQKNKTWTPIMESMLCEIGRMKRRIDLHQPWRRAKYKDLIRETAGADWFDVSPAERRQRAHDMGAEIGKEYEDFEVTGAVFEKLIEPTLIQPTFVTHLPKELVPLAKLSPDDPTTVEVFECCINGQEISPGYTEQNDPITQRATLEHQAGGEQQKLDEDFLVALEHGMPPAGGIGIGIDRLCMMLLGQESIRDVILFPQLKPK
jgi:lysyl-tRNA synthetase class II